MDWKARAMAQVAQLEGLDEEVDKQDEGHKEGGNQEWGDDDKDAATTHSSLNSMGTSTASQGSSAGGDDSDREGGEGEDEDEGDVDDDGEDVEDEDRMAARSEEFSFPKWQVEWDAFGPRDFGISYRSYQKFKTSVEAKSKEKVASPPKELLLAGKRGLELQRAKQAKEIARIEARQRRDDERDQRKAEQLADKLEKAAEREKQKQVRLAERTEHQRKRDEAAREREEQRQKRQAEVEQRRKDREEERLKKKLEKEAADAKKRAAKKERGSFIDEELDTYHLDPPSGQAWDVDGPQIQTGELLAVWNFLATHTKLIACPFYSLSELRGALSIPARAAELTDLHVALMRVLLHDMDLIPDPATGQLADPPRTQLLTALTWPYMACMFLEENESRLGPIESKVSGMLWEMEYHKIEARWKLQLLSILCNECMSCEPCRSTVDDSRSYTSGKDRLSAKRHAMYDSTGRVLDKNEDEDDPDDGKPMHSSKHPRKMRFVRLVGTDRRRNRYFVLGDADGEPAMVVCQKIDVDIYNKAFGVADKFLPKPGDENVKGLLPPKKKAKAGGENGGGVGAVHVNGIAADAAGAGGEVGEAAGASAAGETAAAAAPKETATNEEAEAPVSRGVLYVADSGSEVQANAYASLTAEAYEHAEPQAHDTMRENWTVYASAAELGPLIRYLDPRGFREAALQFKLTDVENALQAREHARLQAVYDEVATGLSGKSTVKQVVRAICAALESAVAAEAARVRSFGIGQKVTVQSMKRQAPAASAWNAVSRLAESADVGAEPLPSEDDVGTRAYESAVLEQRFAADDLNGRAVWAKPPSSQWWPATVVPLCAETVPSNVRKLGKQLNARRRKAHAASGADTAPPAKLVLVQYMETADYNWVDRSELCSFWEHYDRHAKQKAGKQKPESKRFVRALRLARLSRYGECNLKCATLAALLRRRAERICDSMAVVGETLPWQQGGGLEIDRAGWTARLEELTHSLGGSAADGGSPRRSDVEQVPLMCLQLLHQVELAAVSTTPPLVYDWWHNCPYHTGLVAAAASDLPSGDEVAALPLESPKGSPKSPAKNPAVAPGTGAEEGGGEAAAEAAAEAGMSPAMARKCATSAAAAFHIELFRLSLCNAKELVEKKRLAKANAEALAAAEAEAAAAAAAPKGGGKHKRKGSNAGDDAPPQGRTLDVGAAARVAARRHHAAAKRATLRDA